MIQDKAKDYAVQGTHVGSDHRMGISKAFEGHVMSMLAGQYSRPKEAVLREYSTNAADAHVEAGETRPIEVDLPGPLNAVLKIRDYGIGLSEQDIAEIYSQYGMSTKRNTNDQNGTFGIGCKSALAYSSQFTVVSTKDGEQITVVVSRESDGGGNMKVLQRIPTTGENGTEIQIPAMRGDDFIAEAKTVFSGWPAGSILLNGTEPKKYEGLRINDSMLVIEGDYYNSESIVVMANVSYPIEAGHFHSGLPHSSRLVAWIPTGSVTLPPHREALMYDDKTKKFLAGLQDEFAKACKGRVQEEIDKQKNPVEARRVMNEWHNKLPSAARANDYKYKGKDIPSALEAKGHALITTEKSSYRLSAHSKDRPVPIESFDAALFVQNYDRPSFTPGQKKKLNHWLTEQNGTGPDGVRMYVLYGGTLNSNEWIDQSRVIEWKTIEDVKLPRTVGAAKGTSGRIAGSYDFFEDGADYKRGVPGDDIDQTKPIFYYVGSEWDYSYAQALKLDHKKFTLVRLTANRVDKFRRLFPTAKPAGEQIKSSAKTWFKGLSKADVLAMQLQQSSTGHRYRSLDEAKVDDPELKKFIKAMKRNVSSLVARLNTYQSLGGIEGWSNQIGTHPLTNYPLLGNIYVKSDLRGQQAKDHMYLYLNAAYAAEQKGV
jgi:hypothetical protein